MQTMSNQKTETGAAFGQCDLHRSNMDIGIYMQITESQFSSVFIQIFYSTLAALSTDTCMANLKNPCHRVTMQDGAGMAHLLYVIPVCILNCVKTF